MTTLYNRSDFPSATSASSAVKKPLIGLTCRWDAARGVYDLPAEYAEAVAAAGGLPVQIQLIPAVAAEIAARLDAIILTGSPSDVDPSLYGQPRQATVTNVATALDATCFRLLDYAESTGTPVLGICFGMQAINVHRGGSLIQHIPDAVLGALTHQDRAGRHDVSLTEQSCLASWTDSLTQSVNTTHHQSIDRLGDGLRVAARAADGVIEAVEDTKLNHFFVAVQWHPERIWQEHPLSARLFEELMRAASSQSEPRQ